MTSLGLALSFVQAIRSGINSVLRGFPLFVNNNNDYLVVNNQGDYLEIQ